MWQWLMDILPDLRVGTIELRDVANLIVASLAMWLAYLAIRLGQDQKDIAKRQGEIAEIQHQLLQQQLARRPVLAVAAGIENRPPKRPRHVFLLLNNGLTSAHDLRFEISVPHSLPCRLDFETHEDGRRGMIGGEGSFSVYQQNLSGPLLAGGRAILASMTNVHKLNDSSPVIRWRVFSTEGVFPTDSEWGEISVAIIIEQRDSWIALQKQAAEETAGDKLPTGG